ncbi:MAG: MaoC family dehydratase N-terminal domain-containing protein [Chloroflexi bacterium]|nr:MaoC family dehydratase N-terminal domain-containing protein [Chloroflexota bacterium]
MTFSRTPITSLPRGHEFPAVTFVVTAEQARAYADAVGDATPYGNAVPPLAAVALGLASLQERIALPDGALHTAQEVEHAAQVPVGATLALSGRVAQRSERQGFIATVLEFELEAGGAVAVRARTTIMAPAEAA